VSQQVETGRSDPPEQTFSEVGPPEPIYRVISKGAKKRWRSLAESNRSLHRERVAS
jgi:hypothetical protein